MTPVEIALLVLGSMAVGCIIGAFVTCFVLTGKAEGRTWKND